MDKSTTEPAIKRCKLIPILRDNIVWDLKDKKQYPPNSQYRKNLIVALNLLTWLNGDTEVIHIKDAHKENTSE